MANKVVKKMVVKTVVIQEVVMKRAFQKVIIERLVEKMQMEIITINVRSCSLLLILIILNCLLHYRLHDSS